MEPHKATRGTVLQGVKGKKAVVSMLAFVCILFIFLGSQKTPVATVLTSNSWHPLPRLELAVRNGEIEDILSKQTECDHSKGKWVLDNNKPTYSGSSCKRFLSAMWACRLTTRPDFEFEKYAWEPDACRLPPFESHSFLMKVRNKTIAFVGDSLGRQQFQSLMCLITGGDESIHVDDVGGEFGFDLRPLFAVRPAGWAYLFPETNTRVVFSWSSWLGNVEVYNASDPLSASALHMDQPAAFLRNYIHKLDIVVLNTGHHWNRAKLLGNRIEMHMNGSKKLPKNLTVLKDAYNYTVHNVVKFMDTRINHTPELRVFLTTLSPRHFRNGDWDSGGTCENVKPLGYSTSLKSVIDPVAEGAIFNTKVQLLNITFLSRFRGEAHLSKYSITAKNGSQDCLHWCLPGVPDVWNEILHAKLVENSGSYIS